MKHETLIDLKSWTHSGNLLDCFSPLSEDPYAFLLYHEHHCILGHDPFLIFKSKGRHVEIKTRTTLEEKNSERPLLELKKLFSSYAQDYSHNPFFQGGAVGYFSYDLGMTLESLPSRALAISPAPDIEVAFYDKFYLYDRLQSQGWLIAKKLPKENDKEVFSKIESFRKRFNKKAPKSPLDFKNMAPFISNFKKEDYLCAIRKAKDYIAQGDIYQVNFSQRFKTKFSGNPYPLFQELALDYPAPYASYFKTPSLTLMSLSPERFLKIENRHIQTCPIKGTRPRGKSLIEDKILQEELLKSPKDAAELLMIIDLERNDLGKVCEYGSIHVPSLKHLERHPTVFHLVGTIEGDLKPGLNVFDVLEASFPGGSITGTPKIRAMEIIEELEPTRRNLYTGVFGYIGFNQVSDLSILIRTLIHQEKELSFQVGGGIVADSDPEAEYEETLVKGKAFFEIPTRIKAQKTDSKKWIPNEE
ncbi:MAG: aminodeoxychorismate synthase component I [Chlamydiae bacterium]|nr:aminodeoxychorismate synthase component I [Chlamydiota bacterium]MBI3266315.1 aminodeoxychorismate synthase component I [Chlamydiota bacterium]